MNDTDLIQKVDGKIRDIFEQGAIKLFDTVQAEMDKPVKV